MDEIVYTITINNDSKTLFDLEFEEIINKIENEFNGKIKKITMPSRTMPGKYNATISYVLRKEKCNCDYKLS